MSSLLRSARTWLAVAVALVVFGGAVGIAVSRTQPSPERTLAMWFWKADYWLFPVNDQGRLAKLHRDSSRDSRAQCIACHDDKTSSKLVLHRIHLRSPLLTNLTCHDCHQRIDITKRGNRAVVTWVDVGFCKKCHSEFPGLRPDSRMKPAYFDRSCTSCHTGKKAPKHAQRYLPTQVAAAECKGCHGGRVLPSTARHERSDWLKTHGSEALAVGADSCYQCHDFGLKFCDSCHDKKPPTHQPEERWRLIHPEAARADTRACYSCHRLSFCKRCHLNHESGWMQRHSAFVNERGDGSCRECHSRSACTYCHMNGSGSLATTATP